jgi:GNAT superfamily N-acetyltransferase
MHAVEMTTLPPEYWQALKPVFVSEFQTDEMPDPETTEVRAVLEPDGRVACFYLNERDITHASAFWVAPDLRGMGLARLMAEDALSRAEGEGYIAAMTPEAEHLAESLGLTRIAGTLWRKSDVR